MRTYLRGTLGPLLFILLAGCAGRQEPVANGAPVASTNAAVFDPTTGNVPLPNILATATATDPLAGRAVNAPMNPAEALAYINLHEVGGTNAVAGVNAPIYLQFTYPVDPATVLPANIKVFQITPDPGGLTENNPLTFTDVTGLFSFQYTAGTTNLWLFPNFPLQPATRYLYVVTNRVLDAGTGAPIIPSVYFQYLQSTTLPTGAAAALDPVWANAMSGTNIVLSGYNKVMNDLVAASATATTTVTNRTQIALMGRFITSGAGFIQTTPANPTATSTIPVESALRAFAAGGLPGGLSGKTWSNAITVSTTFTSTNANPLLNTAAYWTAVTGGLTGLPATLGTVVLGTINSAYLGMDPVVVSTNKTTIDLTPVAATAQNDAAGVIQPFRDTQGNLTGFYHVPKAIPFVYLAPAGAVPAGGFPLVIYQHGITSQKETVLGLAQALTGSGFAALAIDLPMHGALALPNRTTTQWGQDFMAVGTPLATRSNIQQAAFNLDRLEFTVATGGFAALASPPSITKLHYVGISLGSIVGAYYLAGNAPLPYTQTLLNLSMKGYLSVPGGKLAYLIQASPAFSATVNSGLVAAGIPTGSPTYHAFFQATQTVIDTADPATMTTPLAAGLPSRLSGRLLIQEATSKNFDTLGNPTDGDLVITNPYTRYFGNALGGEGVLGGAGAAVAPLFFQLGYGISDRIPVPFMYTLTGAAPTPKDESAALTPAATAPGEGYFQFDQTGIEHGALLDPAFPVNAGLLQKQMLYFLGVTGTSIAVDPTQPGL